MSTDSGTKAENALDRMQERAVEIGAKGVAVVAWLSDGAGEQWNARMRVVGTMIQENPDGKKFNLIAVAWSKAAEMCVSHRNSGDTTREHLNGEVGWRGGVIRQLDRGFVAAAFSGATSDQDVEISEAGIETFT